MRWKFSSVDGLLYDAAVSDALVIWGQVEGPEFDRRLKDFHPKARAAVHRALVEPSMSGDDGQIRPVLREIITCTLRRRATDSPARRPAD